MLRSIPELSLLRRLPILLFLLAFVAAGLSTYSKLDIETYPNPVPAILRITAQTPGLSTEEMEWYYTMPMEIGLVATPGVEGIRSASFYGLSFMRVTFKYGTDYYFVYTQAVLTLQQNVSPSNNVQPQVQASSLAGEVVYYQLKEPLYFGLTNLRIPQDWMLQRRPKTVPGMVRVVGQGGTTKEYGAEADSKRLEAYGVTLPQMMTALGNANISVGECTINFGQRSVNIRGVGLIQDTKGIDKIILTQTNGMPVQVRGVAKTKTGFAPRPDTAGRDSESDVVTAIMVMSHITQISDVVTHAEAELDKINTDGTLPAGVEVEYYYDRSELVFVITHTAMHALLFDRLLVFFIQRIFLGDLRSAITVSANIPFTLFFNILILLLTSEPANLLSAGAVDLGIVVGSPVILVENILRNFQMPMVEQTCLLMSRDAKVLGPHAPGRLHMILVSALQADRAVFFSALITIAAFIPLFTMQGAEGQILGPMARIYGYALAGALITALTATSALCSYLLSKKTEEKETWLARALYRLYQSALKWSLSNRRTAVTIGAVVLAATTTLMSLLGTGFLPALEEGDLLIRLTMLQTASLESGVVPVSRMRQVLLKHPGVRTVVSAHDRSDDGSGAVGSYDVEFFMSPRPSDQRSARMTKERLVVQVQKEFTSEFTRVDLNFSQYVQDNIEEGLSGVKGANSIKIIGPDLQVLEWPADQVQSEMSRVKGIADLGIFCVLGQPNLNVRINHETATRYGLSTGDVNTVVQAALSGSQATTILEDDWRFALTVRLTPEYRTTIDAVRGIRVAYLDVNDGNAYIPFSVLTDIMLDTGTSYIYCEKDAHYIPVKFSMCGRGLGSTVGEAQQRIAQHVKLPQGYRIGQTNEFEELEQAKQRLAVMMPVSILSILVLFYGLFNSLRDSPMALAGTPFAIIGGVMALFLTGLDFSVSAAIGLVLLSGMSVTDSVLMIIYYDDLRRKRDLQPMEAMSHAAQQRIRPMLMTALSACIGLFPTVVSTGIGNQVQRPLATVIMGGMLVSPLILLVIMPALRMVFLGKEPPPEESTLEEAPV